MIVGILIQEYIMSQRVHMFKVVDLGVVTLRQAQVKSLVIQVVLLVVVVQVETHGMLHKVALQH